MSDVNILPLYNSVPIGNRPHSFNGDYVPIVLKILYLEAARISSLATEMCLKFYL